MKYRLLGRTGLFVSEVSSGTMTYDGEERWAQMGKRYPSGHAITA